MKEKSSIEIFDENYPVIKQNIKAAAESIGKKAEDIVLLAATKTVDAETINHAIKSGIEYIGENRVQEFLSKKEDYAPCHKHFIGHLQTNKIKDIVPYVELIHSVDSFHLAKEISKFSLKNGKITDILLEVNIGNEESKSGFSPEELKQNLADISKLEGVRVKGLMAIPPICENEEENAGYFKEMKKLFVDISAQKTDNINMEILSMGMSDDYVCAIKNGATMVRLGTALFGRRNYTTTK